MRWPKPDILPKDRLGLMLVTDRRRAHLPLPELVRLAVEGGVDAIQVREKDLSVEDLLCLTAQAIEAAAGRAWVVVNGNFDVAKQLGIGVHLPEAGPRVDEARARLGDAAIVGKSVHSPEAASEAQGADYVIAGHVLS